MIVSRSFDPWDLVHNAVSKCADPFCVYANVPNDGLLASVHSPILGADVVRPPKYVHT
jgi:hypothetical protein